MMALKVDIKDAKGGAAGSFDLPAEIFDVQVNVPLIHQVVTAQLNAARQGTHKAKNRGEVSGGGKKPFKQKGTGRARQGSTRSPNQRHGGVAQGPVPRKYDERTPKKMVKAALRGVLSDRQRNDRIHVVTEVTSDINTKAALAAVRQFSNRDRLLVVLAHGEENAWMSLRNEDKLHLIRFDQLNAYDVVVADDVVFSKKAISEFVAGPAKGKSATAIGRESELAEVSA
jgi:large subunit ribosomal protein L4